MGKKVERRGEGDRKEVVNQMDNYKSFAIYSCAVCEQDREGKRATAAGSPSGCRAGKYYVWCYDMISDVQ